MRASEDLTGRAQIYAAAARMCRRMAATTRQLVERNGGNPVPGPSAEAWQIEADRYTTWVGEQTGAGAQAPEESGAPPRH